MMQDSGYWVPDSSCKRGLRSCSSGISWFKSHLVLPLNPPNLAKPEPNRLDKEQKSARGKRVLATKSHKTHKNRVHKKEYGTDPIIVHFRVFSPSDDVPGQQDFFFVRGLLFLWIL